MLKKWPDLSQVDALTNLNQYPNALSRHRYDLQKKWYYISVEIIDRLKCFQ